MRRSRCWLVLALCCCMAACEDLAQDDGAIKSVLPGTWSFTYEADGDLGFELNYELVIFRTDNTCSITYDEGQLDGTYRTGDALISIDVPERDDDHPLLWRLVSFSPYEVVADYLYDADGRSVTVTVTLSKVSSSYSSSSTLARRNKIFRSTWL